MRFIQIWIRKLWPKQSVRVFVQLLGCLEIFLVAPIVLKLTLIRCVIAADLWPRLVNAATIIILEVLARRMHQQVPVIVINKHRRPIMQEIPTHEIEVSTIHRLVNGQGEVVTTLGGAVITQVCRCWQLAPASFCGRSKCGQKIDSGRRGKKEGRGRSPQHPLTKTNAIPWQPANRTGGVPSKPEQRNKQPGPEGKPVGIPHGVALEGSRYQNRCRPVYQLLSHHGPP